MVNYRLCYCEGDDLYFTSKDLNEQTGPDWDVIPYEYNAGHPYEETLEGVSTVKVFRMDYKDTKSATVVIHPCDEWYSSPYCVDEINEGYESWLRIITNATSRDMMLTMVNAGDTFQDVARSLNEVGIKLIEQ